MNEFQSVPHQQPQRAYRVPMFPEPTIINTDSINVKLEPPSLNPGEKHSPHFPTTDISLDIKMETANDPPPPPPIVICPTELDNINITLEKNQQCECKDCGKLFNSVWYLKQHAVKHSNDRPFRCGYCHKTYKFRSNLYQHKCPDRERNKGRGRIAGISQLQANTRRLETNQLIKAKLEASMASEDIFTPATISDTEDNDVPITYGLLIHRVDEPSPVTSMPFIPVQRPPPSLTGHSTSSEEEKEEEPKKEVNCVRIHQLSQEEIDSYLNEHRNKLYTCRKCRLVFPTSASLLRHSGAHSREELFPYKCNNCRQAFECERDLRRHSLLHIGDGPWKCEHCMGYFRSNPALKRHQDSSRCVIGDINNEIMVSSNSPLDPFSFIPSEADLLFGSEETNKTSPDSGIVSSPDHGYSPERFRSSLVAFDMFAPKEKDDDEDSGFRSRLNSVTQTCSPGSSSNFSMEGGSPARKSSGSDRATPNNQYSIGGGGMYSGGEGATFANHFEDPVHGPIQGQLLFGGLENNPVTNVSPCLYDIVPAEEISVDGEGLLYNSVLLTRYENSNARILCKDNLLSAVDVATASSSSLDCSSSSSSFLLSADSFSNWPNNSDKYYDDTQPNSNANEQNEKELEMQEQQIRFLLSQIVLGEIAKAVCAEYVSLAPSSVGETHHIGTASNGKGQ